MASDSWVECELADVCSSIDYGYTAAATDDSQGPRFLRITDIVQPQLAWDTVPHVEADEVTLAKYRLADGDIVLARTGASTGSSAYIQDPPEAVFASYLVRLKIKPTFDARFVSYYLKSDLFWSYIRGVLGDKSAQPNASASTMVRAPFRAPRDLNEQRRISGLLGVFDDKIELNRRMSQTLESMARTLFKSWFVDFDPVRAKAEGRVLGLPQPLARLFPAVLVDSAMGPTPEGWHVDALGSHLALERGVSYNGSGLASGTMPMHNLNSVYEGGGYKDVGIKYYAGEHRPKHVARPGDLIVANTEQGHHRLLIGYAAIVPGRYPTGLFSHHLYRVQALDESPLSSEYLCWLLNSDVMHETVSGYANGTTVNMLPIAGLQRPLVCVPPQHLIRAFTSFAKEIRLRSEVAFRSGLTLAAFRDRLLPGLLSGALVVGEVLGQSGGEL